MAAARFLADVLFCGPIPPQEVNKMQSRGLSGLRELRQLERDIDFYLVEIILKDGRSKKL